MKSFFTQKISRSVAFLIGGLLLAPILFALGSSYPYAHWTIRGTGTTRDTIQFEINTPSAGSSAVLIPGTDNTNDLGSTSAAFKNFYINRVFYGSGTSAQSTAVTSGLSYGDRFTATLGGSVAASEGSNLCAMAPTGSTILVQVCGATDNLVSWVGVAAASASVGSTVSVYSNGYVLAFTSGTVVAGNGLMTSGLSAGYLMATTVSSNNIVGVALTTGTAGGGLTRIAIR